MFINDLPDDIYSQFGMYSDDPTIDSCFISNPDQTDKVKLPDVTSVLLYTNDLQYVVN